MIKAKEILNETKKLQDFQKRQIITGGSMLDCVCYHGFGNIPREIMRMCLEIYIKQGCKNGEYRYQDAVRLVALHKHNADESGFIKWLGIWSDGFSMMRPRSIQNCCDETKERIIRTLFSILPTGIKINVEELITDLDKIFSEEDMMGCGAFGLNLQFCNEIVYSSLTFDFAKLEQSEYRIKRTGQTRDIKYTYILADVNINHMMFENIDKKQNLLDIIKNLLKDSREGK